MIEDSLFGDIPAYQQLGGTKPVQAPSEIRRGTDSASEDIEALPDDFDKMLEAPLTGEEVAMKIAMLNEQGIDVNNETISKDEFLAYHEWHQKQATDFWGLMGDAALTAGKELYGGTLAVATDWKKLAAATGLSMAASPLVGIGAVYGQTIAEGAARGTRDLAGLFYMAANHSGSPLYRLFNPSMDKDQLYQDFLDLSAWNNQTMKYISGKEQMLMPEKATYEKLLGKTLGDTAYDFFGVNHEIATAASYFLDPTLFLTLGTGKVATKAAAHAIAAGAPGKGVQLAAGAAATKAGFVSSALNHGSALLGKAGSAVDSVTAGALTRGGELASKIGYTLSRPIDLAYGHVQRMAENVFGKVVNHTSGRFSVRRAKPDIVGASAPATFGHALVLAGTGGLLFNIPYGGVIAASYAAAKGLQIAGKGSKRLGRAMAGGSLSMLQAARQLTANSAKATGGGHAAVAAIEAASGFTEYMKMLGAASLKGSAYGAALGGLSAGEEGLASGIGAGAVIGSYAANLGAGYGVVSGYNNKQKILAGINTQLKNLKDQGLTLQADRLAEFVDKVREDHGEDEMVRIMGHVLASEQMKDTVVSYIKPEDAIESVLNDPSHFVRNEDGSIKRGPDGKPELTDVARAMLGLATGQQRWNGMFVHENPDGTKRDRPWAMWNDTRTGKRHIVINIDGFVADRDALGNIITGERMVPVGEEVRLRDAEQVDVEGPRPFVEEETESYQNTFRDGVKVDTEEGRSLAQRHDFLRVKERIDKGLPASELENAIEKSRLLSDEQKNELREYHKQIKAEYSKETKDWAQKRAELGKKIKELKEKGKTKEAEALQKEWDKYDSLQNRDAASRAKDLYAAISDVVFDALNSNDPKKIQDVIKKLKDEYGDVAVERALENSAIEKVKTKKKTQLQGPGAPVKALEAGAVEGPRPQGMEARPAGGIFGRKGKERPLTGKTPESTRREGLQRATKVEYAEAQGPGRPVVPEVVGTKIAPRKYAKGKISKDALLEEMYHLWNAIGREQKVRTSVDAIREWLIGDGVSKGLLDTQAKNVVELLRKVVEKEGLAKNVEAKAFYEKLFSDMEQGKIDPDNVVKMETMFEELGAKMFIGYVSGKPFDYIYRHGDLGIIRNTIELLKDKYAQQFQRTASQLGADIRTEKFTADWFKAHEGKQHKFDKTITEAFKDMMRLYRSEALKDAGSYEVKVSALAPAKQVQWAEENGQQHRIKYDDNKQPIGLKSYEEMNRDQHQAMYQAVSELYEAAKLDPSVLDGLDFYLADGYAPDSFPSGMVNKAVGPNGEAMTHNAAFDTVAGRLANEGRLLFQSPDFGDIGPGLSDVQEAQASAPATGKLPEPQYKGARGRPRTTPSGKMLAEMEKALKRVGPNGSIMVFRGVPNEKAFNILAKHLPKSMTENIRRMSMAVIDGGRTVGNLFEGVYHGFEHTNQNGVKSIRADGDVWKPRNVAFVPYEMEFMVNLRNPKTGQYDYKKPHMYARVRTLDMDVLDRRINTLWEEDFEDMSRLYGDKDSFTRHVYKTITEYSSTDLIPSKEFFGKDKEAWERRQYVMAAIGAFPNNNQKSANNGTIGTIDQPYHRFLNRHDELNKNGYNNPWTTFHLGNFKGLVEGGQTKARFVFTEKAYYRAQIPTPMGLDKPGQPTRFNVEGTSRPIMYQAEEPIPGGMVSPVEYLIDRGIDVEGFKSEQALVAKATELVSDPIKLLKEIKKTSWLGKPKETNEPKFQAAETYGAKDKFDGEFLQGNFEYAHEVLGDIFQSEAVKRFIADNMGDKAEFSVIRSTLGEFLAAGGKAEDYYAQFQTGKPVIVVANHGTPIGEFARDTSVSFDPQKAGTKTGAMSAKKAWFHAGNSKTSKKYTESKKDRVFIPIPIEQAHSEFVQEVRKRILPMTQNLDKLVQRQKDLYDILKYNKYSPNEVYFRTEVENYIAELEEMEVPDAYAYTGRKPSMRMENAFEQWYEIANDIVELASQNPDSFKTKQKRVEHIEAIEKKFEALNESIARLTTRQNHSYKLSVLMTGDSGKLFLAEQQFVNYIQNISAIHNKIFDASEDAKESRKTTVIEKTEGGIQRNILAYKNPLVIHYGDKDINQVRKSGHFNTLTANLEKAKAEGHDGVIFTGLSDPEEYDVHYATLVGNEKQILRLESNFRAEQKGPYRRGLNGNEGKGELFQRGDDLGGLERPAPKPIRRLRKTYEEVKAEYPKFQWQEEDDFGQEREYRGRREREKDFEQTDEFEGEEQAALFEEGEELVTRRSGVSEADSSQIHDLYTLAELEEFQKENNLPREETLRDRLASLNAELYEMGANDPLRASATKMVEDIKKRLKGFESSKKGSESINDEDSSVIELSTLAKEVKASLEEAIEVAKIVKDLQNKNTAVPLIASTVNRFLKEKADAHNKKIEDAEIAAAKAKGKKYKKGSEKGRIASSTYYQITSSPYRIGGKSYSYLEITPELIQVKVDEIMGASRQKAKPTEKPSEAKNVVKKTTTPESKPKTKTTKSTIPEEAFVSNNLSPEPPSDPRAKLLMIEAAALYYERLGLQETADRMRNTKTPWSDIVATLEEASFRIAVKDQALDIAKSSLHLELDTRWLTQETVDRLAELGYETNDDGVFPSVKLGDIANVNAKYDFSSDFWSDDIRDAGVSDDIYTDILTGLISRTEAKNRLGEMAGKEHKTSLLWESLQTEMADETSIYVESEVVIKDTEEKEHVMDTLVKAVDENGDEIGGRKVPLWKLYTSEAYAMLTINPEKYSSKLPTKTTEIINKDYSKVKTWEQFKEELRKSPMTKEEKKQAVHDYLLAKQQGIIREYPEVTTRTVEVPITMQEHLRLEGEQRAWEKNFVEMYNLAAENYNIRMGYVESDKRAVRKLESYDQLFEERARRKGEGVAKDIFDRIDYLFKLLEDPSMEAKPFKGAASEARFEKQVIKGDSITDFMTTMFVNKWNADLEKIVADPTHPQHSRVVTLINERFATKMGNVFDVFRKRVEGKTPEQRRQIIRSAIREVREGIIQFSDVEYSRETGKLTKGGEVLPTGSYTRGQGIPGIPEQVLRIEDGKIKVGEFLQIDERTRSMMPLDFLKELIGDTMQRDMDFFKRAIEATRDREAQIKFEESLPEPLREWVKDPDGKPMPVDKALIDAMEKEWARENEADEAAYSANTEAALGSKNISEQELNAAMKTRAAFAKDFNANNKNLIESGLIEARTMDNISDSELIAIAFKNAKMQFKVIDVNGVEMVAFKGEEPKDHKYVRMLTEKDLSESQVQKAYEKAFEKVKNAMRNPDKFELFSEENLQVAKESYRLKAKQFGANAKLTPVERKAASKVGGNLQVQKDGTTRDGQYKVEPKPAPDNRKPLRVLQVEAEANPHTGAPQPQKVVAIVNTPEEAQAAIIKHEEEVREVVEAVTGEPTVNPMQSATVEPPKEIVDATIEAAKQLDSEIIKRPLPEADSQAPVAAQEAPAPAPVAEPQAPKPPPMLGGQIQPGAPVRKLGTIPLDSNKPSDRERWVKGFMEARASQKFGVSVDPKTVDEVKGYKLIMAEDGGAYGYVTPDGEIGGIARAANGTTAHVDAVLRAAIRGGGRWLTAYDTILPDLYAKKGFEAVARVKFDIRYNPDFPTQLFSKFSGGKPDVIAMKYTGKVNEYVKVSNDLPVMSYDEAVDAAKGIKKDAATGAPVEPAAPAPKVEPVKMPPNKHPYFADAVSLVMNAGMTKPVAERLVKDAIGNDMEMPVETIVKNALHQRQVLAEQVKAEEAARAATKPPVQQKKQVQKPKTVILPPPQKVGVVTPEAAPVPTPAPTPAPAPKKTAGTTPKLPAGLPTPPPAPKPKTPSKTLKGYTLDEATAIMLTEFDSFRTTYSHGNYIRQGVTYVNAAGYTIQQVGLSKWRIYNPGKQFIGTSDDEQDAVEQIIKEYYGK